MLICKNRVRLGSGAQWSLRDLAELSWLVLVLVLGIRTFFFYPMSIPSGSMEPTFFGTRVDVLADADMDGDGNENGIREDASFAESGLLERLYGRIVKGVRIIRSQAKSDGSLVILDRNPVSFLGLFSRQRYLIDGVGHTVWFPPDNLWARAGVQSGDVFLRGDDVIRLRLQAGDRILVNRLVFNFRRARRGESIVFSTQGVDAHPRGDFYLKRLVGLGGETLAIGDDRFLRINGRQITHSDRGFEWLSDMASEPAFGVYSGHLNGAIARRYGAGNVARLFPEESSRFEIREAHIFVLGDNSMGSLDSRSWGDFSERAIVGRPSFIFWPLSERFGLAPY